jgi:hypothetical protein
MRIATKEGSYSEFERGKGDNDEPAFSSPTSPLTEKVAARRSSYF